MFLSVIISVIFFICSFTFASEMPSKDIFPITTFTREEQAKGEPIGWRVHKEICREIKYRIMPRLIQVDGRNMLYINANDSGSIIFKPVHLSPEEYPFLSWN